MRRVSVIGGGPAGASAAIAAVQAGARVSLYERSTFPRHKVCGEFLSPEISRLLLDLGIWDRFLAAQPFRYRRLHLHFGNDEVFDDLPEPAFGLSRYVLDKLLLDRACELGAELIREPAPAESSSHPAVIAHGRREELPRGERLFGYKAHFEGPAEDAVSLYFHGSGYTGVNVIEGGLTNVCGLASESALRSAGFDYDEYLSRDGALGERLAPLRRKIEWLTTGPLLFRQRWEAAKEGHYRAGDALSFIDPFTGTGMVSALLSGKLAGEHAAAGKPVTEYLRACQKSLRAPFLVSSLFRAVLSKGWAEKLAPLLPGSLLMRLTRPRV